MVYKYDSLNRLIEVRYPNKVIRYTYDAAGNRTSTQSFSLLVVSGKVLVGTTPLSGVTVTLSGAESAATTTDGEGRYTFQGLAEGGNYTVTPSKSYYTFTPGQAAFTNLTVNKSQNFSAKLNLHTITGAVKVGTAALPGVTMTLSSPTPAGFTPRSVLTQSTGVYTFGNVPAGRSYTLSAAKTNYTFTPVSRSYTNLSSNQTNQNFAATLKTYSISGVVKVGTAALPGATMTITSPTPAGFSPRVVTTNLSGVYTLPNLPAGRNYTLTPSKTNYTFTPSARSYTSLGGNQTSQNFAATLKTYSVTGRVTKTGTTTGIASVTMTATSATPAGFAPRSVLTSSTGVYTFANLPAGRSYVIKPVKTGYAFSPTSKSITNLSANILAGAATNFTGAQTASTSTSSFKFSQSSYSVAEGDDSVEITVTRSADVSEPASVEYEAVDNTASERSDYSTALGTLRFAAGETSKSFTLFITDDAYAEGDEAVSLVISDGAGGSDVARMTINDNDQVESATNPADDPAFFVRQHYVDFLGREPRPEELSAVVHEINDCGAAEAACGRPEVSARFLRSEEFRKTGYFVYLLYRTTLGRAPLYKEFMHDVRMVRGATAVEMTANRQLLAEEWLGRPEPVGLYAELSDEDFVGALLNAAGWPAVSGDSLKNDLAMGTRTRSQILREVIESLASSQKESAEASALMQFFGYLRRNPSPEAYQSLSVELTHDPDGYRKAIRRVTRSAEYRGRFGRN